MYDARHTLTGAPAALKVARGAEQTFLQQEADALRGVAHPHIVRLLACDTLNTGEPCVVLSLHEGTSLSRARQLLRRFAPRQAVSIVRQVASALAEVHSRGFVHCDVKPSHVLLTEAAGPETHCVLIDFGAARRAGARGRVFSTPPYAAPELRRGEPTPSSDVFAVGIMLYEMLSGVPVEHEESRGGRRPLMSIAPTGKSLSELVERATAPSPRDRFEDGRALAAALDDVELPYVSGGEWVTAGLVAPSVATIEMLPSDGECFFSGPEAGQDPSLKPRGGEHPTIWVLTGDRAVDDPRVRIALRSLASRATVELLGPEERVTRAMLVNLGQAAPPWVLVLGATHVRAGDSLSALVSFMDRELGVVLVSDPPDVGALRTGIELFGLEALLPADFDAVEVGVREVVERIRRRRLHYDGLRLHVRDAEEDLGGLLGGGGTQGVLV